MKNVRIADLKAHLSHHLRRVRSGHTLTVVDRDTPVAQIILYKREAPLEIRKATRRAQDRPLPPPAEGRTESLAILLEDRAKRSSHLPGHALAARSFGFEVFGA